MYENSATFGVPAIAPPPDLLRGASLFLDFDGTLVDIAETPDGVDVDARLRGVLAMLADRLGERLAIISGRSTDALQALLGGPALTMVGSHGLEFRFADGRTVAGVRPAGLDAVRERMAELAEHWPHVLVEEKNLGAALHYRLCPEAQDDCVALAAGLAERHGLFLQTGKMMVEVRAPGGDKGTAIHQLMLEPGLRNTRPVFLGDDDTDEPAFRAVDHFGGAGIFVGSPRPSAARYRLPDTRSVIDWLETASRP